jgi:hypothetical protein
MWLPAKDALRLLATVRFPVIQFNPVQQQFMTFGIVPIAGVRGRVNRTLDLGRKPLS